jgi:2-dehydropantoate 2-reductase
MLTAGGILGLGGVGGYEDYGSYAESDQFEIVFIARGETKKQLQSQD